MKRTGEQSPVSLHGKISDQKHNERSLDTAENKDKTNGIGTRGDAGKIHETETDKPELSAAHVMLPVTSYSILVSVKK